MDAHRIELLPNFAITNLTASSAITSDGQAINFSLLMLLPPFQGSSAAMHLGITSDTYINVDSAMRVIGADRMYAVGDCVNFSGPKMGHMAARQGEVAAANLRAEIAGQQPVAHYVHELKLVIDEGGRDSIYLHKDIWTGEPGIVRKGRLWGWAKQLHEKHWEVSFA